MTSEVLKEHRFIWYEKPVLREIYTDFYRRVLACCRSGSTLEIGGGSGNLKEFLGNVVSTDIVPAPWLDAAADAQALPFRNACFDNLVLVDVLHHIECPRRFFTEAERVLKPGGRLIMLEPTITPISWIFYKLFHPEPVELNVDPLEDGVPSLNRKPFDANQAFPTLIFTREHKRFKTLFPNFRVMENSRLSLFAYPLSGGFRHWSLIPASLVPFLLAIESAVMPLLGPLAAFRMFVVLEKNIG